MFMRFVVTRIHEDSHQPQGVFAAAYDLLNSGALDAEDERHLRDTLFWFEKNLPTPGKHFSAQRAVFWFKSEAGESIKRVWELVHLLRSYEYHVEVYKCRRLANIAWQDKFQVAAYPSDRDAKVSVQ